MLTLKQSKRKQENWDKNPKINKKPGNIGCGKSGVQMLFL